MAWLHGRHYWTKVALDDKARHRCSLRTNDKVIARDMERMIAILRGRREWSLLRAAVVGPSTMGELYDHWLGGSARIADLRAKVNEIDLNPHIDMWQEWARRNANDATVEKYLAQVRALVPEGGPFPRSQFTRKFISNALRSVKGSGSTLRRYHAAWSSFGNYLPEAELIEANPLRSIKAPRPNPPRELYLDPADSLRLVEAHAGRYMAMAALREGSGMEISAVLRTRRRDVDMANMVVHAHGQKNRWRDRLVRVDSWAWGPIVAACRAKMPDALLFEAITEEAARREHRRAVKALSLSPNYTMHDSRHSYAVRHMKANDEPQLIANNLGHKDATLVLTRYGKYRPMILDFQRVGLRRVLGRE